MMLVTPFLSLAPYTGQWTKQESAHLLRRATFGAGLSQIKAFALKTVDQCVDELTVELTAPAPPVNVNFENDPDVPIGETWVDKPVSQGVNGYRRRTLNNWSLELMVENNLHVREKMTLFWHNHFVVADINDPRVLYYYIAKLRTHALGNFKEMTKVITVDNAMLEYLNGRDNTRQAPNENYARELMELFTLGKGNSVGNGDYTTYTEGDIMQIAKILTGWIDVRNSLPIRSEFRANRHDTTAKTLSHRFNNRVVENAGAEEYKNLIDIIFEREEVALFICRKLYAWFVYHEITEDIEDTMIKPMAELLRQNDYEIKPVVKALLKSQHFYDTCRVGGIVKSPVDFIMGPLNVFGIALPEDLILKDRALAGLYGFTGTQQMALFQAPSVAGWQAFYQAPLYNKLWLNSFTLPARKTYTDVIANNGIAYGAYRLQIDPIPSVQQCSDPSDPGLLIDEISILFAPKPLAANQKTVLQGVLLGTDTPAQWAGKWNAFIADPSNNTRRQAVVTRLRILFTYMMRMPEFHLQ